MFYSFTQMSVESVWWDYTILWDKNCFNTSDGELNFNAECSYAQMATIDDDFNQSLQLGAYVNNCIQVTGGYGYHDGANTILEYEVRRREYLGINILPSFRINEFNIYGQVDCDPITTDGCIILDAICSGYIEGTQPNICYATPAPTTMNCSADYQDCQGKCYGTKQIDRCGNCLDTTSVDWDSCVGK